MNRAVFENIEDELKEAEKMKKLKEIMVAVVAAAMGKRQIASTVTFSGGCFAATDI